MPWPIKIVDPPPWPVKDGQPTWEAGWAFFTTVEQQKERGMEVTDEYLRLHAATRPPLVVVLPTGAHFCVDAKCQDGVGWHVTGVPPKITIQPSINYVGAYHGWIRDGMISDDCEGRRYDAAGRVRV